MSWGVLEPSITMFWAYNCEVGENDNSTAGTKISINERSAFMRRGEYNTRMVCCQEFYSSFLFIRVLIMRRFNPRRLSTSNRVEKPFWRRAWWLHRTLRA